MKRLVHLLACALVVASASASAQTLPGPAFPISAENLQEEMLLTAAGARSTVAVAWEDLATNLRIRVMHADGTPLTNASIVGNAEDVALASDGSGFILVYSMPNEVRAIRYSGSGERLDSSPLIISAASSESPKVDVTATGRGSYRIFWSEASAIRTATLVGMQLSESVQVVVHAEPLIDVQAQRHPVTGIWLVAATVENACRITCVRSFETTLYASLLTGASAADLGVIEGELTVPQLHVLRDGRIAAASSTGAIGWRFDGVELVQQWILEFDELSCGNAIVEQGSETLVFSSACQTEALFLQPVSARGAIGVNLPVDAVAAGGFPIAAFRTVRGAGITYVADPTNPTVVGRVMPSTLRRGVPRP